MKVERTVYLKDIEKEDLELVLNWRNRDEIRMVMFDNRLISFSQHEKWFQKQITDESSIFKIFYIDSTPYGVLNITNINFINNTCKWGFYIGPKEAPKGLGTILGFTALNYIFYELKMRKLSAEVLEFNEISINFHKKLGFTQEGNLEEHILIGNKPINVLVFTYLLSEWDINSTSINEIVGRELYK